MAGVVPQCYRSTPYILPVFVHITSISDLFPLSRSVNGARCEHLWMTTKGLRLAIRAWWVGKLDESTEFLRTELPRSLLVNIIGKQ